MNSYYLLIIEEVEEENIIPNQITISIIWYHQSVSFIVYRLKINKKIFSNSFIPKKQQKLSKDTNLFSQIIFLLFSSSCLHAFKKD